ncbi:FAD binding domain-containing protein [Salipiger marinus]|uniref:FAD binding domain-containing protein n=1 Tax=Salipiger marinus TaxID=555512 RepID=UPI001E3A41E1|nr:xanthine dehydrogenase family protein subunit M [Salipiger manganoxidans]MCD1619942.1 xanthine dehydrogenase family protein subunit M [Salipiger manganoxidans]MEB3420889.1 xanthine dehydrogenase family protein subunit M [Salipiger manganoxidans]
MTLHRPESLEDALALLGQGGARLLAGGTDLYPALRDGPPPPALIDLTGVPDLQGIRRDASGWRIGGAVTWRQILRAELPPLFAGLKAAAREVGSVQIQSAGTVAGNLCNASPAADGVPALLALEAEVALAGPEGPRRLPLAEFLLGPRRTALGAGEIVTALHVPDRSGTGGFGKLGARRYLVISIAMVGVVVDWQQGRIAAARVAVGACSPVAVRLGALEAALVGQRAADLRAVVVAAPLPELAPIDDVRASADYRRDAVRPLIHDTLHKTLEVSHVA